MKRFRLCVMLFGALAAFSCGRRERPAAPAASLARHLVGDPATLDPTTTTEESGFLVEELIFRPLVGVDRQRRPAPALARSWTVSPDGLAYTFRLDPAARWEDGTAVTSDDVRFTIERIRDPKIDAAVWSSGFEDLVAIETPDPQTVTLRFRQPYAERLADLTVPIVSAAAFGRATSPADTDRKPVGSGPYRLESWESNQKLRLVRRPDVAPSEAPFAEVLFRVIPDVTVRLQAAARGELDEVRVSRDQLRTTAATKDFLERHRVLKVPQFLEAVVLWNCRNPFLADKRVRLALARAWPRQEAARRLYPPDGAALISGPYPPGLPENDPAIAPPPEDLAEAARLLDEAGWKRGPDGIRRKGTQRAAFEMMMLAGQPMYANLGEILRTSYQRVGVELTLRPLDWAAQSERAESGEFDADLTARLFLPPNIDPYPYFHSSQVAPRGLNQGFYRNAEADAAMEAARRELDPAKRIARYREVHRILAADPPADFLWAPEQYWAVARRVDGVEVSPLGLFHFLPGPFGWRPAPAAAP